MSITTTFSRVVGLVLLAAALWSGTALAAGTTPQGLKADSLRLQGIAKVYQQLHGYTPEALMADGLRWQGIARAYQNRPAAAFYTPQALKATGLRWQSMAQAYGVHKTPTVSSSSSNGFDWTDAGIGALGGLGVAVFAAGLILVARRTKLAV
jgi:hypothetical protein